MALSPLREEFLIQVSTFTHWAGCELATWYWHSVCEAFSDTFCDTFLILLILLKSAPPPPPGLGERGRGGGGAHRFPIQTAHFFTCQRAARFSLARSPYYTKCHFPPKCPVRAKMPLF